MNITGILFIKCVLLPLTGSIVGFGPETTFSTINALGSNMQVREAEFGSRIHEYDNVLYLCHRNADPDAIGSGFALQQAFGGDLGAVDGISRAGSCLSEYIDGDIIIDPSPEGYDFVVVVDTAVGLQIGNPVLGSYAVVDHHRDEDLIVGATFYIQKPVDSTAEIVWRILVENGIEISRNMALGLLAGIITDTGRFKHARVGSFQVVAEVLDNCDVEYGDALDILSREPTNVSRRIAILKAARRAKIDWIDDWIVATSKVSSFESSSAMSLMSLGADVAFVGGRHGDVCRISGRARRRAVLAGLDLAAILRSVGKAHDGDGGGHKGAAALEAVGSPAKLLAECKNKVLEVLEGR